MSLLNRGYLWSLHPLEIPHGKWGSIFVHATAGLPTTNLLLQSFVINTALDHVYNSYLLCSCLGRNGLTVVCSWFLAFGFFWYQLVTMFTSPWCIGESWEECAARELLEETGLAIHKFEFAGAANAVLPNERRPAHYVIIILEAELVDPSQEPQNVEPDKCDGWEWVEWPSVPKPVFEPLQIFIDSGYKLKEWKFLYALSLFGTLYIHALKI